MPSAGEVMRASDVNDINGYVQKTADESVTSSTTLQNDNQLLYTIDEAGTYIFEVFLFATSAANAAGDIKYGFAFPAGTLHFSGIGLDNTLASGVDGTMRAQGQLSATSGVSTTVFGLSTNTTIGRLHGILTATAPGTLQLMWAQFASNANASTVKAGSHMLVRQVA